MFEALFGAEMPLPLRFFIAFLIVLALIGAAAYLVRRFGANALNAAASRGRQPRLAVIDGATVDSRRRLVLIRRDNVEHLIMIGGPTDVVVESNIVRAIPASSVRETPPPRVTGGVTDTLPRPMPLAESAMWPLQPEPVQRPQRSLGTAEENIPWPLQAQAEPAPRGHNAERLAGLAADPWRSSAEADRAPQRRPGGSEAKRPSPPAGPVGDDQNLAEMAHRLEAALRQSVQTEDSGEGEPAAKPAGEPLVRSNTASDLMMPLGHRGAAASDSAHSPGEPSAARAEGKPGKPVYESLEQEMASLLGRPSGKT